MRIPGNLHDDNRLLLCSHSAGKKKEKNRHIIEKKTCRRVSCSPGVKRVDMAAVKPGHFVIKTEIIVDSEIHVICIAKYDIPFKNMELDEMEMDWAHKKGAE